MTVRELIALLKEEEPSMPVLFAYNYGDHWHTTVAAQIDRVEVRRVRFSEYHSMDKVVEESDDESPGDDEVVVLR